DFNNTSGTKPALAAKQFGAKIYTVGVGATKAANLVATIIADPYAKVKEEVRITVDLKPAGLEGQTTHVRLYAEPAGSGSRTLIGEKESPQLSGPTQSVQFIYRPEQPGRMHVVAEVDRLPGEVNREKNLAHGEIRIL